MHAVQSTVHLLLAAAVAGLVPALTASADEADAFFDDSAVREIRLTFDDPDWYDTLYAAHARDPEDPYCPARFQYQDVVLEEVGVRFKGNSSFTIPGVKKSFKIDFDEYLEMTFHGLKKLNLNNGFKDPSFLREKLFLDFAAAFVPTIRAVHVRLVVNDAYWGLYLAVEQVDKTFVQSRFGDDEDGNLFKAAASDDAGPQADFGSDMTYLGPDPEPYHERYQLKTNEEEDDYSQLIEVLDVLNNTPAEQLPSMLEPILDVQGCLEALALNNLFVNLDAYNGAAHNYYLYDRDDSGRMTHVHWDTNEAFARFLLFVAPFTDPLRMDPFWLPEPRPNEPAQPRPLMAKLWAVDAYSTAYLRALARMLRGGFATSPMDERIRQLADLIRPHVYADQNTPYTTADFETSLFDDLGAGNGLVYGLLPFVARRSTWMDAELDAYARPTDLRLNEVTAVNITGATDTAGDHDPWIEITNLGPGRVATGNLFLTDDRETPAKWPLPAGHLNDGDHLVLWLDGEPGEGASHASFALDAGGGEVLLFVDEGGSMTPVDAVAYPAAGNDEAYARIPDGEGDWETTDRPTPGAENLGEPVALFINELMADNETTLEGPDGAGGHPDWFELYNPNDDAVDLGGMYLTDDLTDPSRWQVPEGVVIAAHGFLLLWADNDEEQGSTHAGFALDADGEELALYDDDGATVIDSVIFGPQRADTSIAREVDGGEVWFTCSSPTPGASNARPPRTPSGRAGSP